MKSSPVPHQCCAVNKADGDLVEMQYLRPALPLMIAVLSTELTGADLCRWSTWHATCQVL